MKALVMGANGLVGSRVMKLLGNAVGTCHRRPQNGLLKLDITDAEGAGKLISRFSPEVIFHCANLAGGVNFCQSNPKAATDFHLNATKTIGNACSANKATMVFISTDYVFDGKKASYKEEDETNPLNLYGKLKLAAEEWVKANVAKYMIVRTTNIYGWDPETVTPNYVMGLYRALSSGKPFNAPSFLWGNPTYAGDLAGAAVELCMKKAFGVYHVVGRSYVNRFEWATRACEVFGLDKTLVKEIKKPPPGIVPRPMKSRLDAGKFTNSFETALHNIDDGLLLMKRDMRPQ